MFAVVGYHTMVCDAFIFQRNKIDISCKFSARQRIHMRCQAIFS